MTGAVQLNQSARVSAGASAETSYRVRVGDTMSEIAANAGVSLQALIRANPQIRNPDLIFPDQRIAIPGGRGGTAAGGTASAGSTGATAGSGGGTSDISRTAEQYLGRNASELKGDRSDNLPMNAGVPSNVCCANFVSAVLTESGHLPGNLHTDSVATLNTTLRGRGWTEVPASQAQPGDVVIIQSNGISHTVIVSGPGQTIGSNNRNADGSQKVTYGSLDWAVSNGGKILRAPDGGGSGGTRTEAPGRAGGVEPSGTGSRQTRIDQAMTYFESQGWTRAQAAGIVANLDAESGMDHSIRQHGGGPGFGLAQWENPRQRDFAAWAGHDIHQSTFAEQLRFVQHELTGTERGAGNALRGAGSAREAGEIVSRLYERPRDANGAAAYRGGLAAEIAAR